MHPKLHFIEELQYSADSKSVVAYDPNNGVRILDGQIKNQFSASTPAYFSKWLPNYYFGIYSKEDLGINTTWANNSESKKNFARNFLGQFKRINYEMIPDLKGQTYYEAFIHDILKGEIQSENDNLATGVFVRNSRNRYNILNLNESDTDEVFKNKPLALNVKKDANNKILRNGDKIVFDTTLSSDDMNNKVEDLKDKYRNVIIDWIEKEHLHIKNGN